MYHVKNSRAANHCMPASTILCKFEVSYTFGQRNPGQESLKKPVYTERKMGHFLGNTGHLNFLGNSTSTSSIETSVFTDEPSLQPVYVNIFYAIFIPILWFLITIGNLGTIIAFWKLPSLRDKPSELLILSLSCADFITGFIIIPLISPIYITPGYWPFKEMSCRIFIFFMDLAVHASLFTLCMISIDRLLLVLKEYPQYMKIQTHFRIQTTLAIGWTSSMITGIIEVTLWEIAKDLDESAGLIDYTQYCLSPPRRMQEFALSFFLMLYFLPVLLVCGLSTVFFCLLYKRLNKSWKMRAEAQIPPLNLRAVQRHVSPSSLVHQDSQQTMSSQQRNRYIKPAITLLALVTAMATCMLPYSFHVIVVEVFCPECANYHILYSLLLLQFCNACLDPFMYAMTQKKIQTFYKAHLRKLHNKLRFVSWKRGGTADRPLQVISPHTGSRNNIENQVWDEESNDNKIIFLVSGCGLACQQEISLVLVKTLPINY